MAVTPFVWPVRVYYEDTDAGGVVYYANYLKYLERARTEWLRSLGFDQDTLAREQGILFIVHSVVLHYHRPARFNNLLQIRSRVTEARGASLGFEQTVLFAEELLCSGHIEVACVDAESLRPKRIPRAILMEVVGDA